MSVAALVLGLCGPTSAQLPIQTVAVKQATVQIFVPRGATGSRCDRVVAVHRHVAAPAVLAGAMRELLKGPTVAERRAGYGGWFSARTAGKLRSVRITAGVAYIDFADFRKIIPNASSSCGSSLLLAQLNRTATQFPTVTRAVYSFNGSRAAFYNWLQYAPPR
jgi:spore germination protein GerM